MIIIHSVMEIQSPQACGCISSCQWWTGDLCTVASTLRHPKLASNCSQADRNWEISSWWPILVWHTNAPWCSWESLLSGIAIIKFCVHVALGQSEDLTYSYSCCTWAYSVLSALSVSLYKVFIHIRSVQLSNSS